MTAISPSANEDRRMALLDLLDRVIISRADQPEAYRRVFINEEWLRDWLMDRAQWRILIGRGSYRLERLPSSLSPERGLPRLRSPLDYACLCWALWFAEKRLAGVQDWFVISELAVAIATAADGAFSLGLRDHREALVRALQFLADLGILEHRDGDAERWAAAQDRLDESAEVLYTFVDDAPRLLANFDPVGLDKVTGVEFSKPALPRTGEEAPPAVRAWRVLLLGPVFWRGDDPEAFAALVDEEQTFRDDLENALGWHLERGRDHARVWRETTARGAGSVLIDIAPENAQAGAERRQKFIFHPILLLSAGLRGALAAGRLSADQDGAIRISGGALRDLLAGLQRDHRRHWGAELGRLGTGELSDVVLTEMRRMGYLRGPDELDYWVILPIAAMVTGVYDGPPDENDPGEAVADSPPRSGQADLFDPGEGTE